MFGQGAAMLAHDALNTRRDTSEPAARRDSI
jgi:hypothetical protein